MAGEINDNKKEIEKETKKEKNIKKKALKSSKTLKMKIRIFSFPTYSV